MRDTFEGDDDLLRRYLLGELSREETERLEPRLLEDEGLLEQAEAVESDILAEYDRGELTPEQEREVRRRLIATTDGRARLAMVRDLHRLAQQTAPAVPKVVPLARPVSRPAARRPSWYAPLAAMAAALLLAVAGLSVWPHLQGRFGEPPAVEDAGNRIGGTLTPTPPPTPGATVETAPAEEPAPPEPAAETPGVAATPLTTPPQRAEPATIEVPLRAAQRGGEAQEVLVREAPGAGDVALFIPLPDEGFASYEVVLHPPISSERVFRDLALRPSPAGEGLRLELPAAELPAGLYTVEVFGRTADGDRERVGDQDFEIKKR